MRRIAVEINADDKHCGCCMYVDHSMTGTWCDLFVEDDHYVELDVDDVDCDRCDQCLAAEIKGDE